MEKIERLNGRDYSDMLEARFVVEREVFANLEKIDKLNKKYLSRRDIQDEICCAIAKTFVYNGYSSHPAIQEMAELEPGNEDWTEEDNEIWDHNWFLIYRMARSHLNCAIQSVLWNIDNSYKWDCETYFNYSKDN